MDILVNSPNGDNPGQKYAGHYEKMLCFHHHLFFNKESSSFSEI